MNLIISWPKINLQCSVEPYIKNKQLYDWFISGLPYNSIQGHAVVSGDLLYTKNIYVPQILYNYDQLYNELLTEAPVGRVFINVSRGNVGTIMIKYSEAITEDMPYPVIGQVIEKDLIAIKKVGNIVWDGHYNSKHYYLCDFKKESSYE
ncbi:MAG: hypothetical protein A3E87_04815 [Gammaproteobacteria bacterium RIFCSPHIGHO2_12_FULL_35_23]|nr:MAG: hypothetical protein A3E87_04815 [Gammaproteobacteria bacterium RIFCSPHIGHO2_12_FULL_35_23]